LPSDLVVGGIVLVELRRTLTRRIKLPADAVDEILEFLRAREVVPDPKRPSELGIRDPADRWILASALAARVDVLVTGDRDLLVIAPDAPMRIADPRGFWELARKQKPAKAPP
jgi:predicted nucleic acid-binding protein